MSKPTAAPSPRGTNIEQLFLRPLGPTAAAFDAAQRRRANDAVDPDALKQTVDNLTSHLGATLQGADLTTAYSLLSALLNAAVPADDPENADPDDEAGEDVRRRMAGDRKREAARVAYDAHRRVNEAMAKRFPKAVLPGQY
jgi:hypothetical protein